MLEYKYKLDGGSLTSIKVDGIERLFELDPLVWNGQDNVIFPFVARLKNQEYIYNGKNYKMNIHGLAKYSNFKLIEKSANSDTLLLESNSETLKSYPFPFKLLVKYLKEDNKLTVSYEIYNTGNDYMYFGVGGHPGLKVNFEAYDTQGNFLDFEKEETFNYYVLDETGCFIIGKDKLVGIKSLELSKSFFQKYKTLICDSKNFNKVTLRRKDNKKIVFTFNSKYLAIWSKPNCGDYVCIEPWDGLPDFMDCNLELNKKPGINSLKPNDKYVFSYTMTFVE